jgi:outer membrane protein OmpA-like peptidoglycan-associated protein
VVLPALLLGLGQLAGCAVPAAHGTAATSGDRVVIVVSGTTNEPRPALTSAAIGVLEAAANSTNVSEANSARSSLALLSSAEGVATPPIMLTPRRADGSVEHGLDRQTLINRNVADVVSAVAAITARESGLDLLNGLVNATRGITPGTLIVVSNGLSTTGGLDMRQLGWQADPIATARQLAGRDLLPDLSGWQVLFTGLGATAGSQPPLPKPQLDKLTSYWTAICQAAHAKSCEVDQSRVPATPPLAKVATPAVSVPGVDSVVGPNGATTITVSDATFGFAGNSAALSADAHSLLQSLAETIKTRLADRPSTVVVVRGYAADPPGSTDRGRTALATARANVVAAELGSDGVANHISATGIGTEPGRTAMVNGRFDETAASAMRRVVITF